MERLNWHIADELSHRADVRVIGPVGSAKLRPERTAITEVPLRPLWRFLQASAWQAMRTARAWRPHIVLAGSGLTAPAALMAARVVKARSCAYLHGLDVAVQHSIYRMLWHPALRRMDTVIANSQPTVGLIQALGIKADKIRVVHPGVELLRTTQPDAELLAFRKRYGLGDAHLLLSVGRLTPRKGLLEFVQRSLPTIVRGAPHTLLVIIGDAPGNALHARVESRESIQSAADTAGIGRHIRFLGLVPDAELACAYESAALHVFPVRELPGDPEGFGMVAIEAAAHGLPTVAFAVGGVVDAVADGQSGYLVTPGDHSAFALAVLQLLGEQRAAWGEKTIAFARGFAWPAFGDKLHAALQCTSEIDCIRRQ